MPRPRSEIVSGLADAVRIFRAVMAMSESQDFQLVLIARDASGIPMIAACIDPSEKLVSILEAALNHAKGN